MLIYALGGVEFTVDEFLNIANVAADKMKAGDPVEKDAIARLLLLNVKIGYKKAPSYRWKEPFATLLNEQLVNSGAEPAHNFELLSSIADWLFSNKIVDAFRLPQLDAESIRLQRLQPSYTY